MNPLLLTLQSRFSYFGIKSQADNLTVSSIPRTIAVTCGQSLASMIAVSIFAVPSNPPVPNMLDSVCFSEDKISVVCPYLVNSSVLSQFPFVLILRYIES